MASIRRSFALSFAAKGTTFVSATISVMVLARLLTPAEIGVYSVGLAIAALAHVVRDFGIGNYLIQEKGLTIDRIRTALGMAIAIAWTMAILLVAASLPIARYYAEPGLRNVLIVLSATFLIIPISSPVLSLLRRDMAFGVLYVIGVAGSLIHAVTAIALAWLGFGFMSLAWASLATNLTTLLLTTLYRPSIARVLPSFKEWRRVLSFGSYSSAAGLIAQIGMNASDLVIGRMLGFAAVGFYSRAQGLVSVFNRDLMGAVTAVTLPALAIEHREGRLLKEPYLKGLSFITVFAWPFFGFLGLMAYPIVQIFFGPQWDASVPLVQFLCLAGLIYASYNLSESILVAMGQVEKVLAKELLVQSTRVSLILLSALHSLEAVAAGMILVESIGFLISFYYARQLIDLSPRDFIAAVRISLNVTLVTIAAPLVVTMTLDIQPGNIVLPLVLATVGAGIGWVGAVFFLDHSIQYELRRVMGNLHRTMPGAWLRLRR
jgi:O-antigen/teichoic acid export membrane protein